MGTGLGLLGAIQAGTSLAGIPFTLMDMLTEKKAAQEVRGSQQAAIEGAFQQGDTQSDQARATAGRFRQESLGFTGEDGQWNPGYIQQDQATGEQRVNDWAKDYWDRGGMAAQAHETNAAQNALVQEGGTIRQAEWEAQNQLNRLPGYIGQMDAERGIARNQLAGLQTGKELQADFERIADIEGQKKQDEKTYNDLMNNRGSSEIAAAVGPATRQMADLDSQIKRLQAQGRTAASDPQLAQLQAQKSDLSMQVVDATGKIASEKTELWAASTIEMSKNLTSLKDSLMTNITSGIRGIGESVSQIGNFLNASYATESQMVNDAIGAATSVGMAKNAVLSEMAGRVWEGVKADEETRFNATVKFPQMLASEAQARTDAAITQFYAAMSNADAIAARFQEMGLNFQFSYSPSFMMAMDNIGALSGLVGQAYGTALSTAQYNLAGQQASNNQEMGWASVGVQALNPQVGVSGTIGGGAPTWSWGVGRQPVR